MLLLLSFVTVGGCVDGWKSFSIGIQGACSHHGGVNHPGVGIFFCSVLAGCIVSFLIYQIGYPIRKVIKILNIYNRTNSSRQYLEFKYPNQKGQILTFKITPKYIEEIQSNNQYKQYRSFCSEQVTFANVDKLFMQGLDTERKKNIRFRLSHIEDICVKNEYLNVFQQNPWTRKKAYYSSMHDSTQNRSTSSFADDYIYSKTREVNEILDKAIQNHKVITFSYTDRFGRKSNRTFTPQKFVNKGVTLCVEGFDCIKNDIRVFAIKRMYNVEFLNLQATSTDSVKNS